MKKEIKRRIVILVIVSLCFGILPMPEKVWATQDSTNETTETTVAQGETGTAEVETGYVEKSGWEDEEVVVELDDENEDSDGWKYEIQTHDSQKVAVIKELDVSYLKDVKSDIVFRVPDKVIQGENEYPVTIFAPNELNLGGKYITGKFRIYIGKNVTDIRAFLSQEIAFYVHSKNTSFISENGSLFSSDGKKIVRFNDDDYVDGRYTVPKEIVEMEQYAFWGVDAKEIVLNDNIKEIPHHAFQKSKIERIDLKKINTVGSYAFSECDFLQEVIIREEGSNIGIYAFSESGELENIYLPDKTEIDSNAFEGNAKLKNVVMGENVKLAGGAEYIFSKDINLQTVVMSTNINTVKKYMYYKCVSLRKLYLPESVESIETGGFYVCGDLTVYGKEGSVAAEYEDDNVEFKMISEHEHNLREVTFMQYDSWGVKGKYCEECAYGCEIEKVEFGDTIRKEDMPEMMVHPEEKCPESLELNAKNQDYQGVIYRLDDAYMAATVESTNQSMTFPKAIYRIPEKVKKDGKEYVVDRIGTPEATVEWDYEGVIILSDTIKEIKEAGLWRGKKFVLGRNVEIIESDAFYFNKDEIIEIRGENPYFKIEDGCLFDKDKKRLIKYLNSSHRTEYTVPTSVREIDDRAFEYERTLEKITIFNKEKIKISASAFSDCSAEINYVEDLSITYAEETLLPYTWNEEEKSVELDDENRDANGFGYTVNAVESTALLNSVDMSLYESEEQEIVLRIPDKVIKDGKEYTVRTAVLEPTEERQEGHELIRLYIGKYIESISMGNMKWEIASYVHVENEHFVSERGSLLGKKKYNLYRFCDETYDSDACYILPRDLECISPYAFYKADIAEVKFNNRYTTMFGSEFVNSYIRKVNLNQVKTMWSDCFLNCPYLQEVIFGTEGVKIGGVAFSGCKDLKSIYIPPNSELNNVSFCYSGLETIVMGENVSFGAESVECTFLNCYNLRTVILPEGLQRIPKATFEGCATLSKLYIPESVSELGEGCFQYVAADLYAKEGSPVENLTDAGVNFVPLTNHEHKLEQVTFFSFDTWAVTGSYCKECGYGTECKKVEFEEDKSELPKILEQSQLTCPTKLSLNDKQTDPYGLVYELDFNSKTASVIDTDIENYSTRSTVCVPEKVEKDGQLYVVNTVKCPGIRRALVIVLPDTITTLDGWCFENTVREIVLGSGLASINDEAFRNLELDKITLRGECENYVCEDGILYDKNKTKLIKFSKYRTKKIIDFTIPDTVKEILGDAFWRCGSDTGLSQIHNVDREKILLDSQAFAECSAYINYVGTSKLPESTQTPSATPVSTIMPNPSATPVSVVMPNSSESPEMSAFPTQSPIVTPELEITQNSEGNLGNIEKQESKEEVRNISKISESESKQNLRITGFRISSKDNQAVKISWKKNSVAQSYRIYRSNKKNGTYKIIKTVPNSKSSYVNKSVKPLKKYYYKITAVGFFDGAIVEGPESKARFIKITGLGKPKIVVKKGQLEFVRYITVNMKQYQGKYADIYISMGGKKFKKLKLVSNKISRYKGKFKIQYVVKNKTIRLKVRTYRKQGGKKIYSEFSKVIKVKV